MKTLRDKNGFIILDNIKNEYKQTQFIYIFEHNGKKYFFKERSEGMFYNELIAEELAKDYNIPHVHYDIAIYNNKTGVISEDFKKNNLYLSMHEFIYNNGGKENGYINLMDVWNILDEVYDKDIVFKIMNELINIYLFDILIANPDRHDENYGIFTDENSLSPIFDNELLLYEDSIKKSLFEIKIDNLDSRYIYEEKEDINNSLYIFLKESSKTYLNYFKSKLWIISSENINKVFNRIEERTHSKIPSYIKETMLNNFEENRNVILSTIKEIENKRVR